MRNISFSLTEPQFMDDTKTVTRRLNWLNVKAGDRLQGCRKVMGRRNGEPLVKLGAIKVVSVRREPLRKMTDDLDYGLVECKLEGFAGTVNEWPSQFVKFFCESHKGCTPDTIITRIEFRKV